MLQARFLLILHLVIDHTILGFGFFFQNLDFQTNKESNVLNAKFKYAFSHVCRAHGIRALTQQII